MSEAKDILRVSLVQPDLVWEDKDRNLHKFSTLTSSLAGQTDLVVLPEMFSTGFSMRPTALAEPENGPTVQWMSNLAKDLNAVVCGSLIIEDDGKFYNRLFWMRPDGSYETYSKKHLFSFADEEQHYAPGGKRLIVEFMGWKICPLICYDLRFPVWSRNAALDSSQSDWEYDLLIYVANWPEARRKPWVNLLEARAHENQAYVIGVNRVGEDGNGIPHSGDSHAFGPKGDELLSLTAGKESVETVELSYKTITNFRHKFTAWKDKDAFSIK